MFYDLNIPWTSNEQHLQRTLAFLDELGYNVVALNHPLSGKLQSDLTSPIPSSLSFLTPAKLRILKRCTITLSEPSLNHRLSALQNIYDLVAVRPTTANALQQACQHLDNISLISLDLTVRHPYYFKHSICRAAIARGIRFELCYAPGILASDSAARRNLIGNATQLIRATRGRGIVLSSEAKTAVGLRAPIDVVNLAAVWGLNSDRGRDAVDKEAKWVVVAAAMRRSSWRGVIDVVDDGQSSAAPAKRKAAVEMPERAKKAEPQRSEMPLSKRQAKRLRREEERSKKLSEGNEKDPITTTTVDEEPEANKPS
ncbi:MAG: hypothetical protein M1817_005125 [Caeruleum heppii]|nr:MAG: hypothetical protein M1817_005125 [Caeruleum heppii]